MKWVGKNVQVRLQDLVNCLIEIKFQFSDDINNTSLIVKEEDNGTILVRMNHACFSVKFSVFFITKIHYS